MPQRYFVASIQLSTDEVTYEIISELKRPSSNHVTLIQGLPKGSKKESVVKYATIFNTAKIIFTTM